VRYRRGDDRDCGQHAGGDGGGLAERMTAMGIDMAPRGRHGDGDGDGDGTDGQAKDGHRATGRDPAPATVTRTNKHGITLR
jgi:hypothetical protein